MAPRFSLLLLAGATLVGAQEGELPVDDECLVGEDGQEPAHCALNAIQRRGVKTSSVGSGNTSKAPTCQALWHSSNRICADAVRWAVSDGKYTPSAAEWYKEMKDISGVDYTAATEDDFQRMFFCAPPGGKGKGCGTPPCHCSKPPCGTCFGGAPPAPKRAGCENGETGIACQPPKRALDYRGQTWPTITVSGTEPKHIFAIGDWGGLDGSLNPIEGRVAPIAYNWGAREGPSVFPRTRWNKAHSKELCGHKEFIECYNNRGKPPCAWGCGYVPGVDDQPQQLVAQAMKSRAESKDPEFILNVGDNFYWGGIEKTCGTPMDELSFTAHHQFTQIFENMYNGPGLDGKPWLSVLGNHDWGGRQFNNGWDQQITYTWHSKRWVMPSTYWRTTADFVDQGFTVDLFFVDSNHNDAKEPPRDSEHNICGSAHNPPNANCAAAQGPTSIYTCQAWFHTQWYQQQAWLRAAMGSSKADWQIVVTHFPCGHDAGFYRELKGLGLDFLVTGHRHDQELWKDTDYAKNHMGVNCIVTGGGGGISSEATPNPLNTRDWYGEAQYGFYDLTITKSSLYIESINWDGKVVLTHTVYPH